MRQLSLRVGFPPVVANQRHGTPSTTLSISATFSPPLSFLVLDAHCFHKDVLQVLNKISNEPGKVFMKKNSVYLTAFLSLLFLVTAVSAQLASEVRPFDFSDKYYNANGVIPEMLIGRKNGADGESVFDSASERKYNNVRITATLPAYNETHPTRTG